MSRGLSVAASPSPDTSTASHPSSRREDETARPRRLSDMYLAYLPPTASASYQYSNSRIRQQGKVAELRLELNSGGKKDKNYSVKKVALKKIVANMTMSNNDMVALFPDIISCMNIPSLEIKKM